MIADNKIKGIKRATTEINAVLGMTNVLVKVALMYNPETHEVETSSIMGVSDVIAPDYWDGWQLVGYYGCNTPLLERVTMDYIREAVDATINPVQIPRWLYDYNKTHRLERMLPRHYNIVD